MSEWFRTRDRRLLTVVLVASVLIACQRFIYHVIMDDDPWWLMWFVAWYFGFVLSIILAGAVAGLVALARWILQGEH